MEENKGIKQLKGRIILKEIAKKQMEWAELKYLVLSKSQPDYKAIRALFADHNWSDEKELQFRFYIQHALAEPAKKGNSLNAYQHIWGYFKNKATEDEQKKYQKLVDNFSIEQDRLLPFLQELSLKYQEKYLLQSRLLFPLKDITK